MNINRTTTVNLNKKEIEIFMTALARLNGIANWADDHEDELPESAKEMSRLALNVYNELDDFLQWMEVDVGDLIWEYEETDGKNFPDE